MALISAVLHLGQFLGYSIHTRWYRFFAFPFQPPKELAFQGRRELAIAALCFLGGAFFWAALAGLTLALLISIYGRQGYGFDIPILIVFGVFMMLSMIATSTTFYLLVRAAFWHPRSFIEIRGRKHEPEKVYSGILLCVSRTWRLERWRPGIVSPRENRIGQLAEVSIAVSQDPAQVERIGRRGQDDAHCVLCRWLLCRSDDPERGQGYTDGELWLCRECYEKLVKPIQDEHASSS